ncbi:MAG TPA: hypothetical protein VGG63_07035 [Steroidobacteraceae bacterium]|jgi:hypothetical protein
MKPTPSTLFAALACASSLLCVAPAGAQNPMPSQQDELSGFLGDGTCTGHFLLAKSPRATSAKYHSEKLLGDHWIVVRYDEETTSSNSSPYHVVQYFRYDSKAGHFVDVVLDNVGESYGAGTSSGWQGNVMTFENVDLASGNHELFRDVFMREGTVVVSHTGYMHDKNGKWIKVEHEVCKRM